MGFVCHFWATIISNGSPSATGPLSCVSVTLAFIVAKQLDGLRCYLVRRLASAQATLC